MSKKQYHPFINRLLSVRGEIKYAFIVAGISILAIELVIKGLPANNKTYLRIEDMYLRVCYSIVAASIFYFLNQHLPKEEKKLKAYRFITSKVLAIDREIKQMLQNMAIQSERQYKDVTEQMVKQACANIHPMSQVNSLVEATVPFANWYEYFNYKAIIIKENIRDLVLLSDALETDLMEKLLLIEDHLKYLFLDKKRYANADLGNWAYDIYQLTKQSDKACSILAEKYYNRFWDEHNKRFQKERGE